MHNVREICFSLFATCDNKEGNSKARITWKAPCKSCRSHAIISQIAKRCLANCHFTQR
ncbi:hypothetical protein AMELA_G00270860 [Ameiurus melas]|uniref:Uncharacterized protein n=1 Tax=Ameiurus melas TaxID=219545 RepID=A0A7J5ZNV6_AMEME|nr:hypothetical protein AMELA_G00270860 [Ameiurus melas]